MPARQPKKAQSSIDRMFEIARSGTLAPRDASAYAGEGGSEYPRGYRVGGPTTGLQYTTEQQSEFSRLAQSLTYQDARGYHAQSTQQPRGRRAGGPAWYGREVDWHGTSVMSREHLSGLLSAMEKNPIHPKGTDRRSRPGHWRVRSPGGGHLQMDPTGARVDPRNVALHTGEPDYHHLVRKGANAEAALAFREGRAGLASPVDPFEGVNTPTYRRSSMRQGFHRDGRQRDKGRRYSRASSATSGPPEPTFAAGGPKLDAKGSAEGKRRAGKRHRRSRAGSLTQQPRAGTMLGDASGVEVLG